MNVTVVICTDVGNGYIVGVFSNHAKAAEYVDAHAYSSFIISEHTIDVLAKAPKVKADAKA